MRSWPGKRYWVIGASDGLGRAVAMELSKKGAEVILSGGFEGTLNEVAETFPGKTEVVPVNLSDAASVAAAAEAAGEIDGLVYLAEEYWPMGATEYETIKISAMLEINLVGAALVLGSVLPGMVERDRGHIVLTGSLSGYRGLPGAVGYGASKAGVMSLAETLYADLRETGVDVQLVNPGFVRTRMTDRNAFTMPFLMEPETAARVYVDHMQGDDFSRNIPWHYAAMFRVAQFLPDWLYYRLFC